MRCATNTFNAVIGMRANGKTTWQGVVAPVSYHSLSPFPAYLTVSSCSRSLLRYRPEAKP